MKTFLAGLAFVLALLLGPSPDGLVFSKGAEASECGVASGKACDTYFYRVRLWDWATLLPELQSKIKEVMKSESDMMYSFALGAVSRDLGKEIVKGWAKGKHKTVQVCVRGAARLPGFEGDQQFTACPDGDKNTYYEWKLPRATTLNHPDPQFIVTIEKPESCEIVYWSDKRSGGKTGTLSTRTNADGENEIARSVKTTSPGMNLDFILDCKKK